MVICHWHSQIFVQNIFCTKTIYNHHAIWRILFFFLKQHMCSLQATNFLYCTTLHFSKCALNFKLLENVTLNLIIYFIFCILLILVGIPVLVFYLHGQPKRRGYHCDDDSIRYPFRESTISNNVLYVVGIFLPVIVVRFFFLIYSLIWLTYYGNLLMI